MNGLVLLLALLPPQDAAPAEPDSDAVQIEDLKSRIHGMRTSLLFGGEKVREAESEAIDFYATKIESIEQGLDSISVGLSEKRASYEISLEQALGQTDPEQRAMSVRRAQTLRAEISGLEREAEELKAKRASLSSLIGAVQARGRERELHASRLEASGTFDEEFGLSLGAVGLAPDVPLVADVSPFDDPQLLEDMIARDPAGARRVLFDMDPERYWERFPLRPPAAALREALAFPLPDLPGRR